MPPYIPRGPVRVTVTVPRGLHQRLVDRSTLEGRSLSNLAAFLLEQAMAEDPLDRW